MLRTVIIDDEPVFVRSLKTMIERAECNIMVCDTAYDGSTGLSVIHSVKPDLVFADISMPVIDGLTLIEMLRAEGDETPVVILSGYKEFDYAKRAIALDVLEYVLKPIDPVEFKKILKNVGKRLLEKKYNDIHSTISATIYGHSNAEKEQKKYIDLLFDCWRICFGIVNYDRKVGVISDQDRITTDQIKDTLSNLPLSERNIWVMETGYPNEFTLLLTNPQGEKLDTDIYQRLKELSTQTVTLVYGGSKVSWHDLQTSVAHSAEILEKQAVFAKSSIIHSEEEKTQKYQLDSLCKIISENNQKQCCEMLLQFFSMLETQKCTQRDLAYVLRHLLRASSDENLQTQSDYYTNILMEHASDYRELSDKLQKMLFSNETKNDFKISEKSSKAIISSIAEYLSINSTEKISLQNVAEEFGFNYAYMSYLFKKYYNVSPSEYMINCRIIIAKKLLETNPEISIKEISIRIGYDDPYYFSRIFKNITGMSPTEYRNHVISEKTTVKES